MAISVTEILGTDSLSGSRLVINDNFNILASEINAMGSYFNAQAGTINNLNDVKTQSLRVGLSDVIIDIDASGIDIFKNIQTSGNIKLNFAKLIKNDVNPQTLDDVFAGPSMVIPIGTSTAIPSHTINRVGNSTASPLTIELNNGQIGQEIVFAYSLASTGAVDITGSINPIIVPGGTKVKLSAKGSTAVFLCIDNGTGNGDWYLVGGTGYTID